MQWTETGFSTAELIMKIDAEIHRLEMLQIPDDSRMTFQQRQMIASSNSNIQAIINVWQSMRDWVYQSAEQKAADFNSRSTGGKINEMWEKKGL